MSPQCLQFFSLTFAFVHFRLKFMKKVWMYQRKNLSGWWVGWYEGKRRKAKAFPNKILAKHYLQLKYVQLNSDVYTGIIKIGWCDMLKEYEQHKELLGLKDSSMYEALHTVKLFGRALKPENSNHITQNAIDKFILIRKKKVKRHTVNKDISNLKAFCKWATNNRYIKPIKMHKLNVAPTPVNAITGKQVKILLGVVKGDMRWYIRVLLAVCTGLRKNDIEKLKPSDFNLERCTVSTHSKKTSKSMPSRPLPKAIIPILKKYLDSLPDNRLFSDTHTHKKWKRYRNRADMPNLKFQDLRKTFSSLLAQKGVGQAVVQRLLEHSTPELTNKIYTNVDPVLNDAVNRLPAEEWLD